jgi:hypothetical protein
MTELRELPGRLAAGKAASDDHNWLLFHRLDVSRTCDRVSVKRQLSHGAPLTSSVSGISMGIKDLKSSPTLLLQRKGFFFPLCQRGTDGDFTLIVS